MSLIDQFPTTSSPRTAAALEFITEGRYGFLQTERCPPPLDDYSEDERVPSATPSWNSFLASSSRSPHPSNPGWLQQITLDLWRQQRSLLTELSQARADVASALAEAAIAKAERDAQADPSQASLDRLVSIFGEKTVNELLLTARGIIDRKDFELGGTDNKDNDDEDLNDNNDSDKENRKEVVPDNSSYGPDPFGRRKHRSKGNPQRHYSQSFCDMPRRYPKSLQANTRSRRSRISPSGSLLPVPRPLCIPPKFRRKIFQHHHAIASPISEIRRKLPLDQTGTNPLPHLTRRRECV